MKNLIILIFVILILFCGSIAFAQETKCGCGEGGIGLKLGRLVCGFGGKTFKNEPGCYTQFGIGIGIGKEDAQIQFGFGFDQGVIGIGIGLKDPENITRIGFSAGYDYGNCPLVWPIELED
jgi:hypothetical protein